MSDGGTEAVTATVAFEGARDVDVGARDVDVDVGARDVDVGVGAREVVVGVGETVFRMAGIDVVDNARAGFRGGGADPGVSAITKPTMTATAAGPKRAPG